MSWRKIKLGKVLAESKIICENPNPDRRIKVRLKVLGVEKRGLENEIEGATKQFIRKAGQFIYGKQNFHKGAFGIIPNELDGFESSSDLPSFDVSKDCLPEWIFYFFKQGNYYLELAKIARGVATQRIHPNQIFDLEIPLPDIKTQKEYLSNIYRLENKGKELSAELTHQEDLLTQLRQAFLREAMQGKLVKQEAKDGTAKELLQKIKTEKEKLIPEKKMKKEKEFPQIIEKDIPFTIPKNWLWCRLGTICLKITDGTHFSPPNFEKGQFKYVTAKNIKETGVDLAKITFVNKEVHDEIFSRCNPEKGDILYIKDGATTGVVTINNLEEPFSMLSSVALIKLPSCIDNKFLMYLMRSPFYYQATRNDMFGVAITRVTLDKIQKALIPLPPLAEQKRIVKKLEEVMTLCEELKKAISDNQNCTNLLLQVALKDALQPKEV